MWQVWHWRAKLRLEIREEARHKHVADFVDNGLQECSTNADLEDGYDASTPSKFDYVSISTIDFVLDDASLLSQQLSQQQCRFEHVLPHCWCATHLHRGRVRPFRPCFSMNLIRSH